MLFGSKFQLFNPEVELSQPNLTSRDGKILTLTAVKFRLLSQPPPNRCALNFRYRDHAHELAFFELFDL